jgi:uncharacterized protein (TIGR00725 family)
MQRLIAVIGGENCNREAAALAETVGRELARSGFIVICGGKGGIMEAVCRGAKEAGGTTIGVLPGDDCADANPFVDYAIVTGMGRARNVIIVQSALAVIAVDGEFGTLSEIGHALSLDIPVVGLYTWELHRSGGAIDTAMVFAGDPADAVAKAISLAKERE